MPRVHRDRVSRSDRLRTLLQAASALLFNLHLEGWLDGTLYGGPSKAFCIPGLHCYSCPSSVLACPAGTLQNLLAAPGGIPLISSGDPWILAGVLGFVLLPGFVAGRTACSHVCPFGFLQDILHLVHLPPARLPESLRKTKYAILALFVVALPLLLRTVPGGGGDPWFCKAVCPSGTITAGWPLVAFDAGRTLHTGFLFYWKSAIALAVILLSMSVWRPFCRYLCPLGAIWGLAGKVSLFRMGVSSSCTGCGACRRVCPMGIEIRRDPSSPECIRCGRCIPVCPEGAIRMSIRPGKAPR